MSGPVDVLAVLADAIRYEQKADADSGWVAELVATRAAVAELIEAASAGVEGVGGKYLTAAEAQRLRSALARVGGAA